MGMFDLLRGYAQTGTSGLALDPANWNWAAPGAAPWLGGLSDAGNLPSGASLPIRSISAADFPLFAGGADASKSGPSWSSGSLLGPTLGGDGVGASGGAASSMLNSQPITAGDFALNPDNWAFGSPAARLATDSIQSEPLPPPPTKNIPGTNIPDLAHPEEAASPARLGPNPNEEMDPAFVHEPLVLPPDGSEIPYIPQDQDRRPASPQAMGLRAAWNLRQAVMRGRIG